MNNYNTELSQLNTNAELTQEDINEIRENAQSQPPATFNIEMYKTTPSVQDTDTSFFCTAEQPVFIKITITRNINFKTITKALLKIRKTNVAPSEMALYTATENNTIYYNSSSVAAKDTTSNGISYLTANVSNFVVNDVPVSTIHLALAPRRDSTCTCWVENNFSTTPPDIELTCLEDDDFIPNVPTIENTVGSKGKYSINVRNGKMFYFQNIFTANGSRLPFNLSMTYNASNYDKRNTAYTLGSMKGWRFNYQQLLIKNGYDYIYLDGTHKYHHFKMSNNNTSVYNDASTCDGTFLTVTSSGYVISDGKTTTLTFDNNKRLEKISVQQGSSVVSNYILYDINGRLYAVTDGNGDTYGLEYLTGKIVVYKGLPTELSKETLAEIILDSEGRVTQVKNVRSSSTYSFEYNSSNSLTRVLDSSTEQAVKFNYILNEKIGSVFDQIYKNAIAFPIQSRFLSYKYLHSYVDTVPYSTNIAMSTNTAGYEFDANGEVVSMSDGLVAALVKGKAFAYKDDFVSQTITTDLNPIHSFEFNKNSMPASEYTLSPSANYSEYSSIYQYVDLTGKPTNDYVFSAEAVIDNDEWGEGSNPTAVSATLLCADEEAGTLHFDPNQNTCQFRATIVNINPTSVKLQAKISVTNTTGNVRFKNLKITPLSSAISRYCVNKSLNGMETHTEHNSNGSATWYEMQKGTLYCDEENGVANVTFTFKDYLLTKLSLLKNPESYNVWFNDGKKMFANVNSASLSFDTQQNYDLSAIKFATIQSSGNKTTFTYVDAPVIQGSNSLFRVKKVVNGVTTEQQTTVPFAESEEEYDQYLRVCKSTDINGIETTYSYDSYGNTISSTTNPKSNTSLNVKQSFSYNSDGNLSTETDYRTWETYNTTYTYNDENLLASVKTPIDQTTNYTYTADNEKLQSISSTLAYPYYTATNNIVYSGDYVDSLTANDTTFRFTYDERNDVKSVSIRSTEDESMFNFESQSNFNDPWNASRTVTYGNGQKIRRYYDVYNRLIRVNDVTSTYKPLALYIYSAEELSKVESDEIKISNPNDYRLVRSSDAKLRRVIMPTSQSLATVIDYTYDYSGQVTKTNRYNQAITTSDTNVAFNQSQQATSSLTVEQTQKDEYQRTTKTTATCNDITLVNSCTYESFVTDAVTQEKTEVKSGNSTLGTVQTDYTTDALKRLQSVKVTVNGNGYSRDISYVPRQTRTQLPNPGGGVGGTIEPWSLNSIGYKTETVGTTYYPSLITTKELRNNSAVETESLSLTYDANGNITTYGYNTYTYDKFNRLTRENNYYLDKTITWEYDVGGNITSRKEYALKTSGMLLDPIKTDTYSYGSDWKDQLTSFSGKSCIYDLAGNPTTYKGDTLTWEGRLLKTYRKQSNSYASSMNYTAEGLRSLKIEPHEYGSRSHYYVYNGSSLVHEKIVDTASPTTHYLTFLYNGEGLTGFVHNSTVYTYRKNLFGDIIAIYQGNTKVAEYAYDAYGNCTIKLNTANVATLNPFRYRGYYFDEDMKLYYLQSRYYDPETGRFINADDVSFLDPETIHGLNLYAYCLNNPVMYSDPKGKFPLLILAAALLFTPIGSSVAQVAVSTVCYAGMAVASLFDEDIRKDMELIAWNPFNANADNVTKSKKVSFYKGMPVFRANTRSGSFFVILLDRNDNAVDDVKHERGHGWQLMMMGIVNYAISVGIPSPNNLGKWGGYKNPWETMADILGGASRTKTKEEITRAWIYHFISATSFWLTPFWWF